MHNTRAIYKKYILKKKNNASSNNLFEIKEQAKYDATSSL
jgi:hypothetical protein